MSAPSPIFNARAVAEHLESLRDQPGAPAEWWKSAIKIEWDRVRPSTTTAWCNAIYTDEHGVRGRLKLRINGEHHAGRIAPATEAGVAELLAELAAANKRVDGLKARDRKPALQFNRWSAKVETEADEVTLLTDAEGNPVYPPDETRSNYYRVVSCVSEAFVYEARALLKRAAEITAAVVQAKADKVAPGEIVGRAPRGPAIFNAEQSAELRKAYPAQYDALVKGSIVAANTKIAALVQDTISLQAKKNAGMPLPNPIARAGLDFDAKTKVAITRFFDGSKPYFTEGKRQFEVAKVDGVPITSDNVHKFVTPRSGVDGIVLLDSVCFSSMGISMPVKTDIVVVTPAVSSQSELDDVFGDETFGDEPQGGAAARMSPPPPAARAASSVASAAAGAAISADALASMLDDMAPEDDEE